MNDLMSDIVHLRKRLSTQLQVAPFLTGSASNLPNGARKSSLSRTKDTRINTRVLDGATSASTDTMEIVGQITERGKEPRTKTSSDSNLLEHSPSKEENSLENIVIPVPTLPTTKQDREKNQLVCTTYVSQIKRSRTFSDIKELSRSGSSSKVNSYSSVQSVQRSQSVDRMTEFPSSPDAVGSCGSSKHLLPPDAQTNGRSTNHQLQLMTSVVNGSESRPRLDAEGATPSLTPNEPPNQSAQSKRRFKSSHQSLTAQSGKASLKSPRPGRPAPPARVDSAEDGASHFQRQMRKLLRRVERKAERQRREVSSVLKSFLHRWLGVAQQGR